MDFSRQQQLFEPSSLLWNIQLIGCGHSGSAIALALSKLGVSEFSIWDADIVEEINCPGQVLFGPQHIGMSKVEAASQTLRKLAPWTTVIPVRQQYAGQQSLDGIVISAVDSMASRNVIWEHVRMNVGVRWFIDTRVGGEFGECFTIRPWNIDDVEIYEGFFFTDAEALHLPCGAEAIVSTALMIGSIVSSQLVRLTRRESYARRLLFNLARMGLFCDGRVEETTLTTARRGGEESG